MLTYLYLFTTATVVVNNTTPKDMPHNHSPPHAVAMRMVITSKNPSPVPTTSSTNEATPTVPTGWTWQRVSSKGRLPETTYPPTQSTTHSNHATFLQFTRVASDTSELVPLSRPPILLPVIQYHQPSLLGLPVPPGSCIQLQDESNGTWQSFCVNYRIHTMPLSQATLYVRLWSDNTNSKGTPTMRTMAPFIIAKNSCG